jgi:hypothetical protein
MSKRGASSTSPAEKPTVYRGVGAILGGGLAALFCLYGAIDLLVEAGSADLLGSAILLLVVVLAFFFGVYPAAFSNQDGLLVRNPFRTIRLPWSAVTELSARLSFVAHTEGARYTVFAIPVSLRERRKADKQRLKTLAQVQRESRRGGGRGAEPFGGPRPSHHEDHIERLAFADQAINEMDERRRAYAARMKVAAKAAAAATAEGASGGTGSEAAAAVAQPSGAEAAAPDVRWAWPSIVLCAAAAVFVIIALIVK